MAYEKEAADLNYLDAKRVSSADNSKINEREAVLVWARTGDDRRQTCLDYLDTIVSVTNQKYDSGKAVLPGVWRNAGTGYNKQGGYYYLTLREGWATTIDIAECQIQTGSDSRSDARSYTFLWRNIASSAVNACVASLRATGSFTDPAIQGETKTGVFSISEITPIQQADGSYWITVNCIKVASIATIADFATLVPVRKDIHDIENPFGLEGGYTAHVGRKPTDGIVLTYRALTMASRSVIMALTDSALQGLLSVADKAKYEFVKRELTEDSGNTLTLTLVYQYVPLATTITAETARYVGMTRKNQSNKIIIEISWPRINPANIGTISELAIYKRDTVTDPVVEGVTYTGDYFVNTTTAPMTDNDGIRIVQKMTKAGDQTLDMIIGKDPDHKIYEFWRWDISKTDVDEFLTETGGGAHADPQFTWQIPEIGATKMVDVNKQEDESFVLHAVYSSTSGLHRVELAPLLAVDPDGISGTPLDVQESYGKTVKSAFGWNVPIAYLRQYAAYFKPDTAVVNQRNSFKISRQTEHVFDFQGERETFVPIDSEWLVFEDTTLKKVSIRAGDHVLKVSLADDEDFGKPTVVPANTKYEQDFKENDVGSFNGQLTKTEFYKYDVSTVVEDNSEKTVTRREGKYLTAAEVLADFIVGTPPAGTLVEVSPVEKNDVGTYNVTKITTVFKNQTNVSYEVDGEKTLTKTENTAALAALGTPAAVAGHIKNAVNVERPDGKTKTVLVDEEEKDQTAAGGEATVLEVVSVDQHTSGDTVPVPAAAVNVKVDVVEAPTRGNRKRTRKVTSTLQPWAGTDAVVSNDGIVELKQQILKNQTTHPTAAANQEVRVRDNDRGGYDGTKITRALASGAAGPKASHLSSAIEWGVESMTLKTPTWSTSTNSDNDSYITGWNVWRTSIARHRVVTTSINKSRTLTEPAQLSVTIATAGATEGEGTIYSKDAREVREGVWEIIEKTMTTGAWSAFGYRTLTWLQWIQTTVGTGE